MLWIFLTKANKANPTNDLNIPQTPPRSLYVWVQQVNQLAKLLPLDESLMLDEPSGNLVFRFDPQINQATGRAALVEIPYLWESLEHITCPTLVIRAEKSKVLSAEIGRQMVERLPNARYVEIPGAGHQIPLHQPDAFAKVIREFLSE